MSGLTTMARNVRERLEQAMRDEDAKRRARLARMRDAEKGAEARLEPVRQAAEEIREQLQTVPGIEFTIGPTDVSISLSDRALSFGYDRATEAFVGEEIAHSWYDGEAYNETYRWPSAEACIDAMIRLCARYARMANAIAAETRTAGS
jgi:hypothetical protein